MLKSRSAPGVCRRRDLLWPVNLTLAPRGDRVPQEGAQLGDNLALRLGGIYSLERIARDSPRSLDGSRSAVSFCRTNAEAKTPSSSSTPITNCNRPRGVSNADARDVNAIWGTSANGVGQTFRIANFQIANRE